VPIEGATVDLLARNTTTPVLDTTTTSAAGYWAFSYATEGRYDVRITNGSSVRWHMYDASAQFTALEVQTLRVRNPAFTFEYDIVPGAITADRQLNLPVITGTDTLMTLGLAQAITADKTFNDSVNLTLGTGGDVDIYYDGTNLIIAPRIVGTGNVIINTTAILFINDTANTFMTTGVTIQQGAADNEAQAWKSSDVGHAMTAIAEADTFGTIQKAEAAAGGLQIAGFKDADGLSALALHLLGYLGEAADTTDTSTSLGIVNIDAYITDGATGSAAPAATGNAFTVRAGGVTRFLIKGNGDIHVTNTTLSALDDYPDALLMRAGRAAMAPVGSPLHDDYQHLIAEYAPVLEEKRIMFFERDDTGRITGAMNNVMASVMLSWDAHFQTYQKIAELEGEIAELRHRLEAGRN